VAGDRKWGEPRGGEGQNWDWLQLHTQKSGGAPRGSAEKDWGATNEHAFRDIGGLCSPNVQAHPELSSEPQPGPRHSSSKGKDMQPLPSGDSGGGVHAQRRHSAHC
jgi:hypothetical protein